MFYLFYCINSLNLALKVKKSFINLKYTKNILNFLSKIKLLGIISHYFLFLFNKIIVYLLNSFCKKNNLFFLQKKLEYGFKKIVYLYKKKIFLNIKKINSLYKCSNFFIFLLITNNGIFTLKEALKKKVGGLLICKIYI